jgi:hypothetical protein
LPELRLDERWHHVQHIRKHLCAICGDEKSAGGLWFLLAENRWEDKLKILQWDSQLARQDGIRRACSAAHVKELVVHWMTTGSLNYPFARISSDDKAVPRCDGAWPVSVDVDTHVARQIGELAIHRDSVKRVLSESPQYLKTILDALVAALQRESRTTAPETAAENRAQFAVSWEV